MVEEEVYFEPDSERLESCKVESVLEELGGLEEWEEQVVRDPGGLVIDTN